MKTQGGGGHLQAKDRGLRRIRLYPRLDFRLLVSSTVGKYISVVGATPSVVLCNGRLSPLIQGSFFFCCCCCFSGLHPRPVEAPGLGVSSELQLLAYTTATAVPDLSCICDLHHSSWQCWILNPLSEARDQTRNLIVPSRIRFRCTIAGPPHTGFLSVLLGKHLIQASWEASRFYQQGYLGKVPSLEAI